MGGDLGPSVAVEGAVRAAKELGISSILVGAEGDIRPILQRLGASDLATLQVRNATEVITMDDSPSMAIRGKPDSSIRVAFELVRSGEACGVVSAGNTGAVMAAGLYVSGTLAGISRPAIATLIPKTGDLPPTVLLDSGANIDCHAYQLVQFALMGNYYARSALPCESPRIALLSNGTESSKGTDMIRSAAMTLSELKSLNFVGYIEGRDISRDVADVVVCDGFVGNVVLKSMEGAVELVLDSMKHYVEEASMRGKLGMWLSKPILKSLFRDKLDPSAYGGAPLLGLNDIAIICHGASNTRAIINALRVARKFVDEGLVEKMSGALGTLDLKPPGVYEDGIWDRMGQRFEKNKKKQPKKDGQPEAKSASNEESERK